MHLISAGFNQVEYTGCQHCPKHNCVNRLHTKYSNNAFVNVGLATQSEHVKPVTEHK